MNKKISEAKDIILRLPLSVKLVSAITLILFILPYLGLFSSRQSQLGVLLDYEEPIQEPSINGDLSDSDQNDGAEYEEQNFNIH